MTGSVPAGDDPRALLAEQDPRPVVALPRSGLPGGVIALIAVVLAVVLFVVLDGQRRQGRVGRLDPSQTARIASPPPLAVPPEPLPQVPVVTVPVPLPLPAPVIRAAPLPQQLPSPTVIVPVAPVALPTVENAPRPRTPQPRLIEPALVVDGGVEVAGTGTAVTTTTSQAGGGGQGRVSLAGTAGDDAPARASVIRSRTDVMTVGTLIPAVLETPIDTARPGLVRALVSRDTPGFDGRRVLVPRGSRLIGEYQSDVRSGQNRVLVSWTRLIRPDGVSIRLGSPAADPLGGAGVPGHVQSFFLQRFAGAVLQSALQIGVNLASRPRNGSVIVGIPTAPVSAIGQQLQSNNDYRPKITVKQGAVVNVFVARDLDFSGVGAAR